MEQCSGLFAVAGARTAEPEGAMIASDRFRPKKMPMAAIPRRRQQSRRSSPIGGGPGTVIKRDGCLTLSAIPHVVVDRNSARGLSLGDNLSSQRHVVRAVDSSRRQANRESRRRSSLREVEPRDCPQRLPLWQSLRLASLERMSSTPSPNRAWIVGQKILCTDDSFPRCIVGWCNSVPVAGEVYTIRGIQFGHDPTTDHHDVGFLLAEMFNPRINGNEPGFFHTSFIPWSTPMRHTFPQPSNADSKAHDERTSIFHHPPRARLAHRHLRTDREHRHPRTAPSSERFLDRRQRPRKSAVFVRARPPEARRWNRGVTLATHWVTFTVASSPSKSHG